MLKTSFRRLAAALAVVGAILFASAMTASSASAAPVTQLTLSYNSPSSPWTASEVQTMQGWAAQALPLITKAYGQPMHSITVNVVRADSNYAGEYSPSSNTIGMTSLAQDVLIHELIHAYRDDDTLSPATWEEGMTRAVEVQVASQIVPGYWDALHSYTYDQYYDNIRRSKLGVTAGSIWGYGDSSLALLRYQLTGYAWGKVLIQNPNFFPQFNAYLYTHPTIRTNLSALITEAAALQPKVEGVDFTTWYNQQGIFTTTFSAGCAVIDRINQFTADLLCRDANGVETPQIGTVNWTVTSYNGTVLLAGSGVTNSYGVVDLPPFVGSYTGRVKVVLSAQINGTTVSDTSYSYVGTGVENGVFGVTTAAKTGSVTFNSLDGTFASFTVPVSHGAFSAPSLQNIRGRFRVTFTGPNGSVSRYVTKDASAYSLVLKA